MPKTQRWLVSRGKARQDDSQQESRQTNGCKLASSPRDGSASLGWGASLPCAEYNAHLFQLCFVCQNVMLEQEEQYVTHVEDHLIVR